MANRILYLENIKCGGCASFIEGKLRKDYDMHSVKVDIERGTVEIPNSENYDLNEIISTLSKMGYPKIG